MNFEELRTYIAESGILPKATLKENKRKKVDAIFLFHKPDEIESDDFVVYSFNELNGNKDLKQYVLTLKIYSKDALNIVANKENLINLLNFYNRPCLIGNISKLVFSNDSGVYFDEKTKCYVNKLFFDCRTF